MRHRAMIFLAGALIALVVASSAIAKPTQQDVFKSIQDNVGQADESQMRAVPWVCGGIGLIIVLAIFGKRQSRQASPKAVNSPGRLIKEMMKAIPLKPRELKQLKIVAEQTEMDDGGTVENPLVLLLCPSVVIKSVNERNARIDRKTLVGMLKKMGIR